MASWQAEVLTMLSTMNASNENSWSIAHERVYKMTVDTLGERWGRQAVMHAVLNCKWRPAPAELRDIAATIASILPSAASTKAELYHKACTTGYEIDPKWTHELCYLVVKHMGDWKTVMSTHWHLKPDGGEEFTKLFNPAYKQAVDEWKAMVLADLALPKIEQRPYLRIGKGAPVEYKPPRLQADTISERKELPGIQSILKMAPPEIREQILKDVKRIGK